MKLLFYFTIFFFYKTSSTICCPDTWKINHTIYYSWNCMYVDNETEKLRVDESKCPEYGNSREYTKSQQVTVLVSDMNSAISYLNKDSQAPSCAPPGTTRTEYSTRGCPEAKPYLVLIVKDVYGYNRGFVMSDSNSWNTDIFNYTRANSERIMYATINFENEGDSKCNFSIKTPEDRIPPDPDPNHHIWIDYLPSKPGSFFNVINSFSEGCYVIGSTTKYPRFSENITLHGKNVEESKLKFGYELTKGKDSSTLTNSDIKKFPISSTNNEYEKYFFKAQWVNPNCFWSPKPNEKKSARLTSNNFFDWISKLIRF